MFTLSHDPVTHPVTPAPESPGVTPVAPVPETPPPVGAVESDPEPTPLVMSAYNETTIEEDPFTREFFAEYLSEQMSQPVPVAAPAQVPDAEPAPAPVVTAPSVPQGIVSLMPGYSFGDGTTGDTTTVSTTSSASSSSTVVTPPLPPVLRSVQGFVMTTSITGEIVYTSDVPPAPAAPPVSASGFSAQTAEDGRIVLSPAPEAVVPVVPPPVHVAATGGGFDIIVQADGRVFFTRT